MVDLSGEKLFWGVRVWFLYCLAKVVHLPDCDCGFCVRYVKKDLSYPCVFDVIVFYFLYAYVEDLSDASVPE